MQDKLPEDALFTYFFISSVCDQKWYPLLKMYSVLESSGRTNLPGNDATTS